MSIDKESSIEVIDGHGVLSRRKITNSNRVFFLYLIATIYDFYVENLLVLFS